jgi:hypothetical protein
MLIYLFRVDLSLLTPWTSKNYNSLNIQFLIFFLSCKSKSSFINRESLVRRKLWELQYKNLSTATNFSVGKTQRFTSANTKLPMRHYVTHFQFTT